jgi:hypothetical protein
MRRFFLLFALTSGWLFAQPGTPVTQGAWYLLNEASDIHSGDLGCFSPSQVNFANHNATITMIHSAGAYTCGGNNGSNYSSTQDYLSGGIMWHDLNFKPTAGNPVTVEFKLEAGIGHAAGWLLGGNKAANTGCQTTSWKSWDNFSTCNWSSDASDSGEIDIFENVYNSDSNTETRQNVIANGNTHATFQTGLTNIEKNFHLYHIDWSTTEVCFAVDGVQSHCETSDVPQNSMFLIFYLPVAGAQPPSFPQVMTIQYVQICSGTSCTAPDSSGGNTLFYDDFSAQSGPTPPTALTAVPR